MTAEAARTENVTVLFTDIVDSTATQSALPPSAADDLRRDHFAALRRAIAATSGIEVKNLGDGVMVVFRSASAAIDCGVEMQREVDLDNRANGRSIGLRVGVSGGEVIADDNDYFGDPVIEAARLCAKCAGGQILVSELTRLTAGRRLAHDYEHVGELELKGLPDPVGTISVSWEPADAEALVGLALPARLAVEPATGVVGRSAELDGLSAAHERVASGAGCEVVLVAGEPGQGKTTLVAESSRRAHEAGSLVLFGRAEDGLPAPYKLFVDALDHLATHLDDERLDAAIGTSGNDIQRLMPALATRRPDLTITAATDPETERYLLFAAVVSTFTALCDRQTVVLVLDDVQWASQSSLQLLVHLVSSLRASPLLVLMTVRDDELDPSHPLSQAVGALHRHEVLSRIDLAGLDDAAVASLLDAARGAANAGASDELAEQIWRDTDGNPFFVTELAQHLRESGALDHVAAAGDPDVTLPASVSDVIEARVGRLGSDAHKLLLTAALVGRDFDLQLLAATTGADEFDLLDTLDDAMSYSLVRELEGSSGTYRFRHALIHQALEASIGGARRAALHRTIASAIETRWADELDDHAAELARHLSSTGRSSDRSTALHYAHRAGQLALEALAPDLALLHFRHALDLAAELPADAERDLDLRTGLGIAQRRTGDAAFRDTLLEVAADADELGDHVRLCEAALANNRGWSSAVGSIDQERIAVLERVLQTDGCSTADRARVLARLCAEYTWGSPLEFRRSMADEAAAIASDLDDATAVRVLNDLALPMNVPHTLPDSLSRTAEALERAQRVGDPVLLFFSAMWRAQAIGLAGDVAERDHWLGVAAEMSERLGEPTLLWSRMLNDALIALTYGRIDEADEFTTRALELGTETGQPDAATYYSVQQMTICLERGTLGELGPLIEATLDEMPELSDAGAAGLILSHLDGDREAEAEVMMNALAARSYDVTIDHSWITVVVDFAEVAVEYGWADHCDRFLSLLEPWSGLLACSGTTVQGPVDHFVGGLLMVVGRHDEADAAFRRADGFNRRVGSDFFIARTSLWWGRLLGATDDETARAKLVEARDIAQIRGYAKVAERADRALAALAG